MSIECAVFIIHHTEPVGLGHLTLVQVSEGIRNVFWESDR